MADTYVVPVPKTLQELDEAVKEFQTSDFTGEELYRHWQAIREASIEQLPLEVENNPVPGGDSY